MGCYKDITSCFVLFIMLVIFLTKATFGRQICSNLIVVLHAQKWIPKLRVLLYHIL